MADKVKATVSHNQEIDGKSYKAGASVTLDAPLARRLAARGGIQIEDGAASRAVAKPATVAADTKKEAAK